MTQVCVIGAGAMGRLHARTVHRLAEQGAATKLLRIFDRHLARARSLADEYGAEASDDLGMALEGVDAAIVAVSTHAHASLATRLLEAGVDVLVEKPLASSAREGEQLVEVARRTEQILQVGHVEWYNPTWREILHRAGKPRRIHVERLMPLRDRGLDLDVVQDLMLHDLDWVTRSVGGDVVSIEATGRRSEGGRLDEALATLRFATGCEATLSASRVHETERRFVVVRGDRGEFEGSLRASRGDAHSVDAGTAALATDPLSAQWLDFLRSARERSAPTNDGRVGCAALRMVERVQQAIEATPISQSAAAEPGAGPAPGKGAP